MFWFIATCFSHLALKFIVFTTLSRCGVVVKVSHHIVLINFRASNLSKPLQMLKAPTIIMNIFVFTCSFILLLKNIIAPAATKSAISNLPCFSIIIILHLHCHGNATKLNDERLHEYICLHFYILKLSIFTHFALFNTPKLNKRKLFLIQSNVKKWFQTFAVLRE